MLAAALATATLIVVWMLFTQVTSVSDTIVIDRDPSAGWRLAGLLIACGVLLGRSVAGDWASAHELVADWVRWLPTVAGVLAVAILFERVARPRAERPLAPVLTMGVLPAALEVGAAVAVVWFGGGAPA